MTEPSPSGSAAMSLADAALRGSLAGYPFELIRYTLQDQIATITLCDPAKRNALSIPMRAELAQVLAEIRRNRDIRVLVLAGADNHFCSGGELRGIANAGLDNAGWRNRLDDMHQWMRDLFTLDRPVIAAVDGAAAGAGFALALCADFILCSDRAWFAMSFIKMGMVPDFGAFYNLPRVVGVQRAKELMMSGRDVRADEALRIGLAMEVMPADQLMPRAQELAASLVQASPTAISMIKRVLADWGHDLPSLLEHEANAQALAVGTPQHKEAVQRFLNKEPLKFKWPSR